MRLYLTIIAFHLFALGLSAQFSDNFSDGNLSNPNWQGDVANFQVNENEVLQLNASEAGSSTIFLPMTVPDSAVWEIKLIMDFSPSQSNQLQVYLLAQNADFSNSDALYLEIGENGSNDAIHIFQRKGGVITELATSELGVVSSDPVELKLVVKKQMNNWGLAVDFTGGNNPVNIASWGISGLEINAFFGLRCNYTATRIDKFFFDDIVFKQLEADVEPPFLIHAEAISANKIAIDFNEQVMASSMVKENFIITNGIGQPASITITPSEPIPFTLVLSQDLVNGETYTLKSSNIEDGVSNKGESSIDFTYILSESIEPFDIIITEILPDPKPTVGLPETEFIELFNRSSKVLNLKNLTLSVNTTNKSLPDYFLLPDAYVILVNTEDTMLWSSFEHVLGIDLPGLTNSGATLRLSTNETIHETTYSASSYRNNNKDQGGWTLELINPNNPCLGEANWLASNNLQGGTPGQKNSVFDTSYKNDFLIVDRATSLSSASLFLSFDQEVGINGSNIINYSISPNLGISTISVTGNEVTLSLDNPMQAGVVYLLTVQSGITNCIDEAVTETTVLKIGLAENPLPGDVIINEILFNPVTGGRDYVELFNASNKIININSLAITNLMRDSDIEVISASGLLFPNTYVAITENIFQVIDQYNPPDTAWIMENNLPGFDDKEGNVSLVSAGIIIDSMNYDEEMHIAFISNQDGVALERINPFSRSTERSNWISGASNTNYGTPGYQNGQYSKTNTMGSDFIEVERKICSPNGDGFEDFVLFQYNVPTSGYVLNAKIYNGEGQYIHRLINNEVLAQKGQFRWDGVGDDGMPVSTGIYVVRFEFFQSGGEKVVVLKSCGVVWE